MNRQEWMLLWLAGSSHHRAGKTETFKQCFTNEYLGKFGVRSLLMIETVKQQVPKKIPKIKTRGSYIIKLLHVGDMPKSPSSQYGLKAQKDIDLREIRVTNGLMR